MSYEDIPSELRVLPQWVAWRNVTRNGKTTKVPVNPATGKYAKSNTPSTWGSYDDAQAYVNAGKADGIGFMLADDQAYTGVDLDHVLNPNGSVKDAYRGIVEASDTYVERSPSGEGLHIIFKGKKPGITSKSGDVEMYDHGRFFTFTGDTVSGAGKLSDGGAALSDIYDTWLNPAGRTQSSTLLGRKDAALASNAELAKKTLKVVFDNSGGDMRAVLDAYPDLVRMYGRQAAQVALEYYRDVRTAQGVDSRYDPQIGDAYDQERLEEDARYGVFKEGNAAMNGGVLAGDFAKAYQFLESRMINRLYGYSDYAEWQAAMRDPAKPRWAFVPHAGACGWCILMGSRGFNYVSDATVSATRHEHCSCSTAVDFSKNPKLANYDPEACYNMYANATSDANMAKWNAEWKAMTPEEQSKFERGRDGYLRNRTVQEMNVMLGHTKSTAFDKAAQSA